MLFVETADILAMMARETLVQARLPSFHIPCAVEVLTWAHTRGCPRAFGTRLCLLILSPLQKEKALCKGWIRSSSIVLCRLICLPK
ncbi:mediator of RNA polymerase II transcription subunit 14-like [Rhipicephalus sanguineus]|uniref:mediator of RNA polymerase II transcription subunit 14-like n=1 Tax=Rhipicephalus sanguineus TaxID=34632 RepID=UPI0020C575DF|nr:mediator of RNA polymerase II transcription subunit 14-like [Rhipicephalus sanguineus]